MRLGALLGPVNPARPDSIAEQAKTLEASGYTSLWAAQSIGRGFMSIDPMVALSIAAGVTEEVELGTAILQLPLYRPVNVALQTFSLMQTSGNRLTLGVGAGSTEADYKAFGLPFENRFRQFNEDLETLRHWFAEGKIDDSDLTPWPSVKGGPPIYYGTWGKGVARAAKEFSGWIASGMYRTPDELEIAIKGYRAAGGQRAIVSTILLAPDKDIREIETQLGRYREAGFDDAVVMFLPGGATPEEVRKLVD